MGTEAAASTKGKVVGHATCPYCGDKDAEVKHDKRGNPYLICWACPKPSQHFTLGDAHRIKALLGGDKFRPLPGVELPTWATSASPKPASGAGTQPPAPAAAPKKTTLMG